MNELWKEAMSVKKAIIASSKQTKVLIGVPFGRPQDMIPQQAWTTLIVTASMNPRYEIVTKYAGGASSYINRDIIVQTALDKNCDWCLMIDTDMSYPANLLDILISRNKDVIGVPYYSRGLDPRTKQKTITPVIYDYDKKNQIWYRWEKVKQTVPFRVSAVGTGIFLVKTDVFRKLKKPWFRYSSYKDKGIVKPIGEDVAFCMKCADEGFEVWVDPIFGDAIKHWHIYSYSKKDCTEK